MKLTMFANFRNAKNSIFLFIFLLIILAAFYFDKGLAVSCLLLVILSGVTFFTSSRVSKVDYFQKN